MKANIKNLQERKENQYKEQIVFFTILATAMTLRNNNISVERMIKILSEVQTQVDELSKYLTANTCIYKDGKKDFDVDYNIETLRRLAEDYHVHFNDDIFRV